ncbi:MAG: polysaccharide ABC transporter ATP-binding protein [bacterium]
MTPLPQSSNPAIKQSPQSPPAISVRNLSKCYQLGAIGRHTLVDEVQYWWHKARGRDPREHFSKVGHTATEARKVEAERKGAELFWALKDVSFDVQPGEVIGIIGRNGAGKSTLLKILTRITEPTSGEAFINGRVASLLEVGTGFHPDLTGRENVYMNGTILGMKKREIAAKFDEIVAFSELEQFIDTPVKRYSSGMYVRLAFAVAAHLEPEILLVDEVLAVGDAAFQQKCLGKMSEVAGHGRTILFVSHNMAAVNRLCGRAILLEHGRIVRQGSAEEVSTAYLSVGPDTGRSGKTANEGVELREIILFVGAKRGAQVARVSDALRVRINYTVTTPQSFYCVVAFFFQGVLAFATMEPSARCYTQPGDYIAEVAIPPHLLTEGIYTADVYLLVGSSISPHILVRWNEAMRFNVYDPLTGDSARGDYSGPFDGLVRPKLQWTAGSDDRQRVE